MNKKKNRFKEIAFELDDIVPWGRSYNEYIKMFSLTDDELKLNILSIADGPASFNSGLTSRGGRVTSIDPIYRFTSAQIERRINEAYETILEEARKNKENFVWEKILSVEELGKISMQAMQSFLADFENGKNQKRYVAAKLPKLPFKEKEFDLCLCSHFLFLYSGHLSLQFHKETISEAIRVSREVRIFPMLTLDGKKSEYVKPVIDDIIAIGYSGTIEKVDYEFQRDGNEMLRIRACIK